MFSEHICVITIIWIWIIYADIYHINIYRYIFHLYITIIFAMNRNHNGTLNSMENVRQQLIHYTELEKEQLSYIFISRMWIKAFEWNCIEDSKVCILLVWNSEAYPAQICLVSRELSSSEVANLVSRQPFWDFMWQAYTLFETDCIRCGCFVLYYLPWIRDVQESNDLDNCLLTMHIKACLCRIFL